MSYYFSRFLTFALFLTITVISCSDDDDYGTPIDVPTCDAAQIILLDQTTERQVLGVADFPTDIRSYVASEFSGFAVDSISLITADVVSYYVVILRSNDKLLFDSSFSFICGVGDFISQEGDDDYDDEYIDIADLPQSIIDYVAANYPNETIVKAELDDGEYEIELSNDVELYFDLEGNFLRVD